MATASRTFGSRKWTGVLRRVRTGIAHLGRLPTSRNHRLSFQVRVRHLPRVAWGRPAVKWGLGRRRLWPLFGRSGAGWIRSGAGGVRTGAGWARSEVRSPRTPAPNLRAASRFRRGRWGLRVGVGFRVAAFALLAAALLVMPLLAGEGVRQHLALYWEGTAAPLARWVRLDATTAFWLVSGMIPDGTTLAARADLEPPAGGLPATNGSGSGSIWPEARAWLAKVAQRLPRWMLMSEFPALGTAAVAPDSGARSAPAGGQGPADGQTPAPAGAPGEGTPAANGAGLGVRNPAPAEPSGPAGGRSVLSGPGEPLVLIYHSHSSEMYREEGEPLREASTYHRFNSTDTGVVRAGRVLARALEDQGVPVVHDTGTYDYPSHPSAYLESGRAVAELLRRYPSIRAVVDLHRDTPADMTATVNGRRVARITLVVATAVESSLPHANWRENLAFAQELARVMEERTPGLLDKILQVPNRRYNQELHPHGLLVEVGSYHNTQAEADAAAELLAQSLARVVLESAARPGTPGPGPARP